MSESSTLIESMFDAVIHELRTVGVFSLYVADRVEALAAEMAYDDECSVGEPPLCDCGRYHWHGGPDGYECGF